MARTRGLETVLFWAMLLLGTAVLAPCLILPPWIEYQAQLERRKAAEAYVAALEQRLRAAEKQIDHLQNDPAYLLRLAQREFGDDIPTPGAETILIDPSPNEPAALSDDETGIATDAAGEEFLPELSTFLERVIRRYPRARLFVDSRSRPVLMGLGGALLLTAMVLLGRAGVGKARQRMYRP
ncbi:MAG: hypothetical protein KAY37_12210 [Phycisphaerae bacterium]|nr:hypothetical protein [Phycisphaerae bacterium]